MPVAETRVAERAAVGPPGGAGADELNAGEVADLVAYLVGCGDDLGAQQLQRDAAALDRGGSCEAQHPQRLDHAVFALGGVGPPLCQGSAGGGFGVQGVDLAAAVPVGAVGPVDLADFHAGLSEVAADAGAVAPVPTTPTRRTSPWRRIQASSAR